MTKENTKHFIKFVGSNSNEVTGSANLVKFMGHSLLVDYGIRQTTKEEEDYKVNSKRHKDVKPRELCAVIITHPHLDHIGLIPALFKDGADCPIYAPKNSKALLTLSWQDSVHRFKVNEEKLKQKPIYTQEDVDKALAHIVECENQDKIIINENISMIYYNAKHIVCSRQVLLELNNGINIKRIGFTGDISNKVKTYYVNDFESLPSVDILVGECTYGNNKRIHKSKDRAKDEEKLKMSIESALSKKGKILIPTFTLDRLQILLTTLYKMYDGNSPIKILVNTPLGKNYCDTWYNVVEKNQELWDEVKNWKDVRWVTDYKEMMAFSKIPESFLILGSGGFLQGGTSVFWTKELLGNKKNRLVFCGYSSPESIAGQIKSGELKQIKIEGKVLDNKADITILNSFSSHMDYEELIDYYTTTGYNKLCLVHGEADSKNKFAGELKFHLSKANRTSKIISVNKDTKISI